MSIFRLPSASTAGAQTTSGGSASWGERPQECAAVSSEVSALEVLDEDDLAYERAVDWSLTRLGARMARRRRPAA